MMLCSIVPVGFMESLASASLYDTSDNTSATDVNYICL